MLKLNHMMAGNIELYEALKQAKVPEQQARAAAEGFLPADDIATKSDIRLLKSDIKALENRVDGKLKDLELRMVKWMVANSITIIAVILTIFTILELT